jgi:hypothetical protein
LAVVAVAQTEPLVLLSREALVVLVEDLQPGHWQVVLEQLVKEIMVAVIQ